MRVNKIITGILSLCSIGSILFFVQNHTNYPITANAAEILDSGYCRDITFVTGDTNLTYTFDSDGVLTISGIGKMCDFITRDRTPWFVYRDDIKKVVIEEGVTSVGERSLGSFENCKEISLPSTIKRIDEFCNYVSLESITLPEGLEEIDVQTFVNCDLLKTVTIPSTVTSIGKGAFEWCDSLYEIKVASGNSSYVDIDGVLYTKDMTKIVQYPEAKSLTSYIVPSTVTTIGEDAFYNAKNLEKIILPGGLTAIEKSAFNGSGIKSMSIPAGVTVISRSAFNSCKALTTMVIPSNITKIEILAFRNNVNLEKIVIENPLCEFADYESTISSNMHANEHYNGTIYGYAGSTAQTYAEKYGYQFDLIENYTIEYKLGDVNSDGCVSVEDAVLTLTYYAQSAAGLQPENNALFANIARGDIDQNQIITVEDAVKILTYYARQAAGLQPDWDTIA